MLALGREAVGWRSCVTVGDVDLSVGGDGHVGGVVERCLQRPAGRVWPRVRTIRPSGVSLRNLVLVPVADVEVVVGARVDAVGIAEPAVAPPREEVSVRSNTMIGGSLRW